ncbi:MAG: translational GTPase TypA [Anaerolineae bacterium]|nr:translational GTPase TypA [Ardenticatenia bacterium]MBK8539877.1 translational GTPase TypA [Ardenticatenia bacterium]HQZ70319.1 translational GTPase TypA [Anaerolineae bacterium]
MRRQDIRNIAIIAHVDHGKTTLVDAMLRQTDVFHAKQVVQDRVMDSGDLERERGITILAKNAAIRYQGTKINILDTPGHADFGGEVERVLNMVDGVLLLVDAVEGPMPQTRFVLRKALALGHKVVVVVNKMDRPQARPEVVVDATFDLFIDLGASEEQCDFTVVYARALAGTASMDATQPGEDLRPLFEAILKLPAPQVAPDEPLQMLVTSLDYDDYKGRIAIGRLSAGRIRRGQELVMLEPDKPARRGRAAELFVFENLGRHAVEQAESGDIVALSGLPDVAIGETIADPQTPRALPPIRVEEPTLRMSIMVNNSPLAGREGKHITSRVIGDRLQRELERNVSLRVEPGESADTFMVSGRGELHLAILVETMRREGYELAVGNPEVITHEVDGKLQEPYEEAFIEVAEEHVGVVVEMLGRRRAEMQAMQPTGDGAISLTYIVPTRGLLGFRGSFLTATRGTGVIHTIFNAYRPWSGEIEHREQGSLVAHETGLVTSYALNMVQERGDLFIEPGIDVYAGQIVGRRPKAGDLVVNVCRKKHVTNHRKSIAEEGIALTTPIRLSLDEAIEYIGPDELVEVTPLSLRLRKRELDAEKRQKGEKRARYALAEAVG